MKMLILASIVLAADGVAGHAEIGDTVDLTKDEAISLARMGRVMYLDKSDDPTKGQLTASAEDKARVKRSLEALKAEREQRDAASQAASPVGMAALVAAAVAQAVQQAMTAQAKPAGA